MVSHLVDPTWWVTIRIAISFFILARGKDFIYQQETSCFWVCLQDENAPENPGWERYYNAFLLASWILIETCELIHMLPLPFGDVSQGHSIGFYRMSTWLDSFLQVPSWVMAKFYHSCILQSSRRDDTLWRRRIAYCATLSGCTINSWSSYQPGTSLLDTAQ